MSRIISEELWDDLDEYIIRTRRDANEGDLLKEADRLRISLRNAPTALDVSSLPKRVVVWEGVGSVEVVRTSDLQLLLQSKGGR